MTLLIHYCYRSYHAYNHPGRRHRAVRLLQYSACHSRSSLIHAIINTPAIHHATPYVQVYMCRADISMVSPRASVHPHSSIHHCVFLCIHASVHAFMHKSNAPLINGCHDHSTTRSSHTFVDPCNHRSIKPCMNSPLRKSPTHGVWRYCFSQLDSPSEVPHEILELVF